MKSKDDSGGFPAPCPVAERMCLRRNGLQALTFLFTLFLLTTCCAAGADDAAGRVGTVKNVSGEGYLVRNGRSIPARPGVLIFRGDRLVTGADGTMGILLDDDTALSLGPSTESTIDEFAYHPGEGKLGMVVRVARGVFGYLSGKIAKLAPGSVRIETPVATLGVRGTYFVARIEP